MHSENNGNLLHKAVFIPFSMLECIEVILPCGNLDKHKVMNTVLSLQLFNRKNKVRKL